MPAPRILLTGALAVVGPWVVRLLLERGAELLATDVVDDNGLASDLEGRIRFETLDLTSAKGMRSTFAEFRPDVVVHLAAVMPMYAGEHPTARSR